MRIKGPNTVDAAAQTSQNGTTTNGASTPAGRRAAKVRRKRLLWGGGILAALIAAIALVVHNRRADTGLSDLQTAQAFRTTLLENISATGSVTAQTGAMVKIGSQVTGRIRALHADVGSHVKAGQVIAELDNPDLEAQLGQAEAQLGQAMAHYLQQVQGVGMERAQTGAAVSSAQSTLRGAQARYRSAVAAASQQPEQTAADIGRAQAALRTAHATLNQVRKSHDLQIETAQSAINQAQASEKNAAANLARQTQLFKQGYTAAADVDTAATQESVAAAQLASARQNLSLTQAKADADVQTAEQQVAQAQAGLSAANAERYTTTSRQQDVRTAAADIAQTEAQLANAEAGLQQNVLKRQDVQAARDAVRQAEALVRFQQAQIAKTYIKSPISGTVLSLAAQQGETVAAGLSAPTLITVADLDRLQVDAFVDETDIGKARVGQSCSVTVDAYPDQTFSGRVTKVASGATIQQNVVTYDVAVAVKDPKHLLKPDMTASVNIAVGQHPNVVAVPNEAIKEGKSGKYVWLVPAGGQAQGQQPTPQMQPVETGATDGTYTEITSGLADGDTVVLAGWPPSGGVGGPGMRMTPFGPRPGGPRRGGRG